MHHSAEVTRGCSLLCLEASRTGSAGQQVYESWLLRHGRDDSSACNGGLLYQSRPIGGLRRALACP